MRHRCMELFRSSLYEKELEGSQGRTGYDGID